MAQSTVAAAVPGPTQTGTLWRAPALAVEKAEDWGRVSVAVFRRGDGASVWRNPRHRIVFSPGSIGPIALSFDGGPTHRFTPPPSTLGFYPAGAEVSVSHGPGRVVQVLQDPALYGDILPDIGGGRDGLSIGPVVNFADPLVVRIARSLACDVGGGPADRLLADALGMALAARLARRFLPLREPPDPAAGGLSRERLRRVLDHIEAHLGEELTLAGLAAVACLSPCHFSRCFKRAVGVGPHRYVARRRIERAREMIRRTEEPIAAIAQALGFADQSHFTNAFRRETGATPARFRASLA